MKFGAIRQAILTPVALTACLLAVPLSAASAFDDDVVQVDQRAVALSALDFDPWQVQEDDIEPRRVEIEAYQREVAAVAADTAADRSDAEVEVADDEADLDAALAHRAAMETEVEEYSIAIWVLGDLGLQETFETEAERARHAEPVIASTEALIERVEEADAAIVDAENALADSEAVLAERVTVDEIAQAELREATSIVERFESMVTARADAIDRWTHDALESEDETIAMVTITSVTVQVPIEPPAGGDEEVAAAGVSGNLQQEDPADGGAGADEPAGPPEEEPVPTRATTVAIPPIVVNAEIAENVRALIGAARSDGIELHGGGYRPVADQITLRIAHCGTSGYDIFERPAGECTPPTATPGNSQHELGLAVDFTVDGSIVSSGSPAFSWLVANAGTYGLINLPSEAWHWSTTGS